jgi:hypothetical protein
MKEPIDAALEFCIASCRLPAARGPFLRSFRDPRRHKVFLSTALASQPVGLREENDGRWLVTFMNLDLGHLFIALR